MATTNTDRQSGVASSTASQDRRQGVNASAAIKVPCVVATTANITLSGEQTIDGVAIVTNDRVLVKDQTDGIENGIYIADTSAWNRAPDWDGSLDVKKGTLIYVHSGTINTGWWGPTTADTITPGTTSVTISTIEIKNVIATGSTTPRSLEDRFADVASVTDFGGSDGIDLTSSIQAAIDSLPSTGGIVDVNVLGGTFGIILMNKPGTLRFGFGTFTAIALSSSTINVGSDKRVIIEGQGVGLTTIKGSLAGQKLFQYSGLHTGSSGFEKYTAIQDMTIDGDNLSDYGIYVPDHSGTFTWNGAHKVFQRLTVRDFTTAGLWTGSSSFYTYVYLCLFTGNEIGVHNGQSADITLFQSSFSNAQDGPVFDCLGTQVKVISCFFGTATGDGPDIRLSGTSSAGTVLITGNYFGPETERATRYKIEFSESAGTTYVFSDVFITNNWFYGITNQTCFKVDQPLSQVHITNNLFKTFPLIFDENEVMNAGSRVGRCKFTGNFVVNPASTIEQRVFDNGGRHFDTVEYPTNTTGITVPNREISGLQNRIRYADENYNPPGDAYNWYAGTGTSISTGENDSQGGTKAAEFTADGASSSENILIRIDTTSLLDDEGNAASGHNGRVVVRFGAKAGTLSVVDMLVDDATDGSVAFHSIPLTAAWKTHEIVVTGIDPAYNTRIRFYPGGSGITVAGTVFFEFLSVSDFGSEFVPTNGSMIDLIGEALAIRTLADDATPSVVGRQRETFLTGGTTTITDLDDGVLGDERTILSEHAITITDGTNIFLNGSANFVMASTDSLTLLQKADGKWYEISRSVN